MKLRSPSPPHNAPAPQAKEVLKAEDWQRWNDYGIGLLLQGDLKGAQAAFQKVTEIDPKNPDGWVNIGRAAVQEGDMERARTVLRESAVADARDLARAHFFYAKVLRSDGNYDGAADHVCRSPGAISAGPRRAQRSGRSLFLQRKYAEAVKVLQSVLAIDPEDLAGALQPDALLQRPGQGEASATSIEQRYMRFKADESAQAITGPYGSFIPKTTTSGSHSRARRVPLAPATKARQ